MKLLIYPVILAGSMVCVGQEYGVKDLAVLNSLPGKFEHYWNIHNMDSMGTMLTEDVDFINVAGTWFRGKAATVYDHKDSHATMFRTSVFKVDSVQIRYVKPDLAILHIGWGIIGDFDPDGTPRKPRHGIFTWVVVKRKGEWLIHTASNVNIRKSS
ncbi:MAG TPA: SgcJ/EcaC family oxidoreductase [Puia sp.]|nr:SgcJ/EcaC family oxidoreductase [Puia sp.]